MKTLDFLHRNAPPVWQRVLLATRQIGKIPHLEAFFPEIGSFCLPVTNGGGVDGWRSFDAVAGWGRKPSSVRARHTAQSKGLPYLSLEDGFLRSWGLGVEGVPPLSLIMDRAGIYYDSTPESDLENLLQKSDLSPVLLQRAVVAMDWLRQSRLCKYNGVMRAYAGAEIKHLIIDQTAEDASVVLSGASPGAFEQMIEDALSHYAADDIAVKLHPDTMAGKKAGYLRELALRHGLRLIDQPVETWDLLAATKEVSTISSQLGFDALMAGKKVHCYGVPFYAGWGLTQDRVACSRRYRSRSVVEVFAAAYLQYARYIDPYTGLRTELESTIGLLSDLARYERQSAGWRCPVSVSFSPRKWWFLRKFTGRNVGYRLQQPVAEQKETAFLWGVGIKNEGAAGDLIRVEDGFVRSQGLGAKFARPWSWVMDGRGIYFDPRYPSDIEYLLQTAEIPQGLLNRASLIRQLLVEGTISKYNTGKTDDAVVREIRRSAGGRRVILVPGQVEDDASIRTGTVDGCRTNADLLRATRAAAPEAYIVYKPHPDVEVGKRAGRVSREDVLRYADIQADGLNIATLWPVVDAVHTLTSLTGFEALLRDKNVYVYGNPFYAGWGLTHDRAENPRRSRRLTLDALVAVTLVLYPRYFDWQTRRLCNIETVIYRLSGKRLDPCSTA